MNELKESMERFTRNMTHTAESLKQINEKLRRELERYQNQRWYVKAYRWLRWKPYYTVLACLWIVFRGRYVYIPVGDKPDFKLDMWTAYQSIADYKMKHYYTCEEVIKRL